LIKTRVTLLLTQRCWNICKLSLST